MNQNQPLFIELLGQFEKLNQYLQSFKGNLSELPPEIVQAMMRLKKEIKTFKDIERKEFEKNDVNIKKLKKVGSEQPKMDPVDKLILKRFEKLEKELKKNQSYLSYREAQNHLSSEEKDENEANKKKMKKRQQSFKSLGGDSRWIPL